MIGETHEKDLFSLLETLKDRNKSQTHFRKCANEREKKLICILQLRKCQRFKPLSNAAAVKKMLKRIGKKLLSIPILEPPSLLHPILKGPNSDNGFSQGDPVLSSEILLLFSQFPPKKSSCKLA